MIEQDLGELSLGNVASFYMEKVFSKGETDCLQWLCKASDSV